MNFQFHYNTNSKETSKTIPKLCPKFVRNLEKSVKISKCQTPDFRQLTGKIPFYSRV